MDEFNERNEDFKGDSCESSEQYRPLPSRFPEIASGDLADQVMQEIVGQDEAVQEVCSFLSIQLAKLNYNMEYRGDWDFQEVPIKSLMITGPSGCGKTATVECACRCLGIPVARIDASSKVPTGFSGQNWQTVISDALSQMAADFPGEPMDRLVTRFDMGSVVILDEFDKAIEPVRGSSINNYHTLSQGTLLKLLEGATYRAEDLGINCEGETTVSTKNTIFVLAGSFSGLDDAVREGRGKEIRMARDRELSALDARLADMAAGRESERAGEERKCLGLRNRILQAEAAMAACRLEADKALMEDRDRLAELENRAGLIHCELVDRSRLLSDLGREGGSARTIGFTCVDSMAPAAPVRERDVRGRAVKERRRCMDRGKELDDIQSSIDTLRIRINAKEEVYRRKLEKLTLKRDELNLSLSKASTILAESSEKEASLQAERSRLISSYAARLEELERPGSHTEPALDILIRYFSLLPEIAGRMAGLVVMKPLDEEAMMEIASRSRGTDRSRLEEFFGSRNIQLEISDKARLAMVQKAMKKGLGARGLVNVLSEVIYPYYPDLQANSPCLATIEEDCITKGTAPDIFHIPEDVGENL